MSPSGVTSNRRSSRAIAGVTALLRVKRVLRFRKAGASPTCEPRTLSLQCVEPLLDTGSIRKRGEQLLQGCCGAVSLARGVEGVGGQHAVSDPEHPVVARGR